MSRARDVAAAPAMEPRPGGHARSLVRRVASAAILLPVFVWAVSFAPPAVFVGMVLLVGGLGQWEFTRMFHRAGIPVLPGVGLAAGLAVTASFALPAAPAPVLTAALGAVLVASLIRRGEPARAWEAVAVTLLGIGYVNWLLGHALWLHRLEAGVEWVLLLAWVTWLGETAAYLVGSTMGRRPLAPAVSPKKTVEGAAAQMIVSVLAAVTAPGWLVASLGRWEAVGIGLGLGVVGQAGDLVESWLKRSVGTKDSGQLIPGHGGMLDRVDGLLFNTPALFYYVAYGRSLAS
jgi:phosphatidate cytidylyltransferase